MLHGSSASRDWTSAPLLRASCALPVAFAAALLLGGCSRSARDRAVLAHHGVEGLTYRQMMQVARAAKYAPEAQVAAPARDDTADPPPPARTDVPPDAWVAAFPAPDVEPHPTMPAVPTRHAVADDALPMEATASPPAPPAPEPVAAAAPAPVQTVYVEQPAPPPQVVYVAPPAYQGDYPAYAAPAPVAYGEGTETYVPVEVPVVAVAGIVQASPPAPAASPVRIVVVNQAAAAPPPEPRSPAPAHPQLVAPAPAHPAIGPMRVSASRR